MSRFCLMCSRCRSRCAHACRAPLLSERALRGHLPSSMRAGSIVSVSAQVKACELDAVIVAGNRFEDTRRDRRLRICFGVRADWMARLRGASLVGAWAWRLGFEVCALTGGIVWRLRARDCVGACDGLAPMSLASWLRSASRACLAPAGCSLLLCAKGLERAFDEGLACRAHRAGEGCELV